MKTPAPTHAVVDRLTSSRPARPMVPLSSVPTTSFGFFARRMFPSRPVAWINTPFLSRWTNVVSALVLAFTVVAARASTAALDHWQSVTISSNALKSVNDLIFANGEFWAAGATGKIQHSANGVNWTVVQTPTLNHLNSIIYANGRYVSVGYYFSILSSTDGANWTIHVQNPNDGFASYEQVIFGNGQFVAVGGKGQAQLSTNGVNWTPVTMNYPEFHPEGVAWGNGVYVTVGQGIGANNIMTSPNGSTWTKRSAGVTDMLESVAFGKGLFVATGWNNTILSSPDGITWTKRPVTLPNQGRFWSVTFTNGHFIAIGQNGRLFTSPDGMAWTAQASGGSAGISALAYSGDTVLFFRELSGGVRRSDPWALVATDDVPNQPSEPTTPGGSAKIGNLSTRAWVGTGETQLISGFVIQGAGNKKVLVRAIGPTLTAFGVPGALADPQVRILSSNGVEVASNNDWSTSPDASAIVAASGAVGAFPLAAGTKDAVALVTLTPGSYNILISGVGDTTGVALVEVYDTDAAAGCKLINISSRAFVSAGGNAAIPGFVIEGNAPRKLLIRGVGPTLGSFGVGGVLADPRITLFNSNQVKIAENDDWSAVADPVALKTATANVGAFALNAESADAAMLVTVQPGAYTVVVSGANDAMTGIGLVEIYEVP